MGSASPQWQQFGGGARREGWKQEVARGMLASEGEKRWAASERSSGSGCQADSKADGPVMPTTGQRLMS